VEVLRFEESFISKRSNCIIDYYICRYGTRIGNYTYGSKQGYILDLIATI